LKHGTTITFSAIFSSRQRVILIPAGSKTSLRGETGGGELVLAVCHGAITCTFSIATEWGILRGYSREIYTRICGILPNGNSLVLTASLGSVTVARSVAVGLGGGRREHRTTDAISVVHQAGIFESIRLFHLFLLSQIVQKVDVEGLC
jgi:hypothetical protein